MWFILRASDEATLAITQYKDAADIIAASFSCRCLVRFATINCNEDSNKMAVVSAKAAIA